MDLSVDNTTADINTMGIFLVDVILQEIGQKILQEDADGIENSEWESDEELVCHKRQTRMTRETTIGTRNTTYCLETKTHFLKVPLPISQIVSIDHLVFHTNLYANRQEITAFISVNFLMGVKLLPSYRDYWSSRLELRDSYISSAISRDRFT